MENILSWCCIQEILKNLLGMSLYNCSISISSSVKCGCPSCKDESLG